MVCEGVLVTNPVVVMKQQKQIKERFIFAYF